MGLFIEAHHEIFILCLLLEIFCQILDSADSYLAMSDLFKLFSSRPTFHGQTLLVFLKNRIEINLNLVIQKNIKNNKIDVNMNVNPKRKKRFNSLRYRNSSVIEMLYSVIELLIKIVQNGFSHLFKMFSVMMFFNNEQYFNNVLETFCDS